MWAFRDSMLRQKKLDWEGSVNPRQKWRGGPQRGTRVRRGHVFSLWNIPGETNFREAMFTLFG